MKTKIILATLALSINAFAQIPTNGLVANYQFNGNANDGSGNNNNGTVNGAALTVDRLGNANSAYSFNGSTSYIDIPHSTTLNFASNAISITFWAKINTVPSNGYSSIILSKQNGSGTTMQGFNVFANTAQTVGLLTSNGGANFGGTTSTNVSLGIYHHFAYTIIGGTAISYLDGIQTNISTGQTATIGSNTVNLLIGKATWSNINAVNFNGVIDELNIYNRALSQSEINQVYSTTCLPEITTGLVARLPFNGNANDFSINANNGNVIGATLTADRFGNVNSAYSFNGTSNYIEVPNSSSLQFASGLQSISFWMKIPSIPNPLDQEGIIEKMNQNLGTDATGSSAQGFLIVFAPDGSLYYSIKNGAGNNWGSVAITSNKYQINQYCNIAFTNDNDSLRAYVNSVKVNATKIPAGTRIGTNNLSMLIGKSVWMSNGASMDFFNGIVDDIAIYDRALTQCDIDSIYNMPNQSTTGVNMAENINLTIVFPNPTTEKINLKITEPTDVKIYNYAGQVIKIFKNSIGQIDVSDLNNGIYFLELQDQNSNQISIHKFMKN